MPAQESRTGQCGQAKRGVRDRHDGFIEEVFRAIGHGRAPSVADREVDVLRVQIDHPGAGGQPHLDCGVRLQEGAEARHQPQAGDPGGRGDGHPPLPLRSLERADHILQLLQRAVGAAEQALAFRREGDRTVPAYQQLETERFFQRVYLPAYRGLGEAKIARRERDAHAASRGHKAAQQIERRQTYKRS